MTRKRTLAPRRRTHLPNASTLGYGKYYAEPGDYVIVKSEERFAFGRVLGQIVDIESDGLEDCRGYLAVAMVAQDCTFGYERWYAPEDILECTAPTHANDFLRCFTQSTVAETEAALRANSGILASSPQSGKLWGSACQCPDPKSPDPENWRCMYCWIKAHPDFEQQSLVQPASPRR